MKTASIDKETLEAVDVVIQHLAKSIEEGLAAGWSQREEIAALAQLIGARATIED